MEDLNKMKVTELKQALKDRSLPSSGTKPELVKRLEEALGGDAVESSNEAGSVDDSLQEIEDEILNEDTDTDVPAPTKPAEAEIVPHKKIETIMAPKDDGDSAKSDVAKEADSGNIAKPEAVSKLSEEERKKLRAEKYGIVSPEDQKSKRAERFGLPMTGTTNTSAKISSTGTEVDLDKLKKRAERFGEVVSTSLSKVDVDEKMRKRAARFGECMTTDTTTTSSSGGSKVSVTDSDLEAKKKKRAERFAEAT